MGSVLILGEKLTLSNIIGVFLIVFSLGLIFWEKQIKINKGQKFALFATIFSGLALVIDGLILRNFSAAFYLVISSLFTGAGTLAIKPKSIFEIKPFVKTKVFFSITFISAIFALAVFLMYYSFQLGGKMAAIAPITQSVAVFTIFLSALFLKETRDLPKKIVALALCILGMSFLK